MRARIAGALAFPQIFHPQWARDWYRVKRWSLDSGHSLMHFVGELSECQATGCRDGGEVGSTFKAKQAWEVFFHELNSDPTLGIPQELDRASDIICSNGSISQGCKP